MANKSEYRNISLPSRALVEALSKADVDLLMYFEEICCPVWTDEQIKGYLPLDKERWT